MPIKKIFFLFSTSILLTCFNLFSQEWEDATKKIENKWGIKEDDKKSVITKGISSENPIPTFLTQFQPAKQEYSINPSMENVIKGRYGTKITLPANSISLPLGYKKGDILSLELIEVYNDLDFITSGVSLFYHDSKPNIFESGGMFKLTASYYDKPLNLKRGVKLKVEMPNLYNTNKKMKMYKLDEREGWVDKGDINRLETKNKQANEEFTPKDVPNKEGQTATDTGVSFLFRFMDDFKWWNCDYPNPDTTCIEGKVIPIEANPPYSITSVGIDYKNAATRYTDNSKFQINAIRGKRIKLIAMDEKGNIGLSKEINTGDLATFLKQGEKGKCTDVGTIQIEKTSRDILKDRKKLLKHIGLVDIIEP